MNENFAKDGGIKELLIKTVSSEVRFTKDPIGLGKTYCTDCLGSGPLIWKGKSDSGSVMRLKISDLLLTDEQMSRLDPFFLRAPIDYALLTTAC